MVNDPNLRVWSPLGIRASLEAIDRLSVEHDAERQAIQRQVQQLEYTTARAFEQYNAVDARNRLVASELERRWNETLAFARTRNVMRSAARPARREDEF